MIGERHTVLMNCQVTVPWDFPEHRVPFVKYLENFEKKLQKEDRGWRFERVLRIERDPVVHLDTKTGRRSYVIRALFSRPQVGLKFDLPEWAIRALMEKHPDQITQRNLS